VSPTLLLRSRPSTVLNAGFGSGGASSPAKKSKKKKIGTQKQTSSSSASSSGTPFDVNASMARLEKKFDELTLKAAKQLQESETDADDDNLSLRSKTNNDDDFLTSEYIVAARAASRSGMIPDWVPIAQLCLRRPESHYNEGAADPMVQMAVSAYCRELSHVAAVGAPVFSTLARNEIQYSVESVESFHKHVYDEVIDGQAKKKETDAGMTKSEARAVLKLNIGDDTTQIIDKAAIKQAYRKLSFELHPDRFEGTEEECDRARIEFARVQLAYETLTSGVRGNDNISWYESLGGRARTGFVGPINLMPLSSAHEHLQRHQAEGGLCGLDPNLTQSFVARHLRSA
jgi:DnaJ domain